MQGLRAIEGRMKKATATVQDIREYRVPKCFSGDRFIKPAHLSILRSRIYTEVWKQTEGEPVGIRRGKVFARYLDSMRISLDLIRALRDFIWKTHMPLNSKLKLLWFLMARSFLLSGLYSDPARPS